MRTPARRPLAAWLGALWLASCAQLGAPPRERAPDGAQPSAGAAPVPAAAVADAWPRQLQLADAQVTVHPPQIDSWRGNQLTFRCVVDVRSAGSDEVRMGVVHATARAQVDRVQRAVGLEDLALTHGEFPSSPETGAPLIAQLREPLAAGLRSLPLDRFESWLAAASGFAPVRVPVRNAPPVIFVSFAPAVLIPIDGRPVWRPISDTGCERVLNTRAAILREAGGRSVHLHVYDGWLTAGSVSGPWSRAPGAPPCVAAAAAELARDAPLDWIDGGGVQPRPTLANGAPAIFVSQRPAELIVFEGQPQLEPIGATGLRWARNTTARVLFDTSDDAWYALLAGRWFIAPALSGPWSFVPSTGLPAAFRAIPASSPAGIVLASVAGTREAREAEISNAIPQMARIPLANGPSHAPRYDGAPQLAAIPGTALQYVRNSAVPTLRVDAQAWYALRAGVWFVAASVEGPFRIATLVPSLISTIPPASPLHYVTYAHVYGSTADAVEVGYTPGYLGSVASSDGVVVYGTGYDHEPWIGSVWLAPQPTWGMQAQPIRSPALGWSWGFAPGLTTAALLEAWGAPVHYTVARHGQPCCGSAGADVYARPGDGSGGGPFADRLGGSAW